MATTKIKNTSFSQIPSDIKLEASVCDSAFHSDAAPEFSDPSVLNSGEVTCTQHPLASLLGTFAGPTWDEIRQEIAQDHQKEDADALKG